MKAMKKKILLVLMLCLSVSSMGITIGARIQTVSAYDEEEINAKGLTSLPVENEEQLRMVLSVIDNTTVEEIVITENIELKDYLYLTNKNITIRGEEGKDIVITSSAYEFLRFIAIENTTAVTTFKDITFDYGNSYGGIFINRGTVILDNCSVKNFVSDNSGIGAVRIIQGELIVNGGSFTNNDSAIEYSSNTYPVGGGAITILESSSYQNENWELIDSLNLPTYVELNNVTFKDNSSVNGGAIRFYQDDKGNELHINNCTFENNSATENGGAIYAAGFDKTVGYGNIDNSNIYIDGVTFKGNTAGNGGYGFNEAYKEDVAAYKSLVKNVKELSSPFRLDSQRSYMTYAYNNHDISYKSMIPGVAYYSLEYNNNFAGKEEALYSFITHYKEDEEISIITNIDDIDADMPEDVRFSKDGYLFLGWSEDKNATEPTYTADNNALIMPDKDVTLYAIWKLETFNITFKDADGTVLDSQEINYGEGAKLIDNPTKVSDDEYTYTFDQWVPQGNYSLDALTNVKEDMTFVARYKAVKIKDEEKEPEGEKEPEVEKEPEDEGEVLGEEHTNTTTTTTVTQPSKTVTTSDDTRIMLWSGISLGMLVILGYALKARKEENN